jgi:hypothetical protein
MSLAPSDMHGVRALTPRLRLPLSTTRGLEHPLILKFFLADLDNAQLGP